jgi:hypothetical protein
LKAYIPAASRREVEIINAKMIINTGGQSGEKHLSYL